MTDRCAWVTDDPVYIHYHDHEWGRPVYDDDKLFEMISLEGAQAGLNWLTILKRRDAYREAFSYFDPREVAAYTESDIQKRLGNPGIIRNERKIRSVIKNARCFIELQEAYGSFSAYIWQFTDGKQVANRPESADDVPAQTEVSRAMAKALKKHGFSFVGPTICYAFMQAIGMVDDHTMDCFLGEYKREI